MGREDLNNQNISVGKMGFLAACLGLVSGKSPMGKIIDGSVTNTEN